VIGRFSDCGCMETSISLASMDIQHAPTSALRDDSTRLWLTDRLPIGNAGEQSCEDWRGKVAWKRQDEGRPAVLAPDSKVRGQSAIVTGRWSSLIVFERSEGTSRRRNERPEPRSQPARQCNRAQIRRSSNHSWHLIPGALALWRRTHCGMRW
jgi:hypothetical protein